MAISEHDRSRQRGDRGPGGGAVGGAILNEIGSLSLLNTTVSGNSVTGGTSGAGGGIFNCGGQTIARQHHGLRKPGDRSR